MAKFRLKSFWIWMMIASQALTGLYLLAWVVSGNPGWLVGAAFFPAAAFLFWKLEVSGPWASQATRPASTTFPPPPRFSSPSANPLTPISTPYQNPSPNQLESPSQNPFPPAVLIGWRCWQLRPDSEGRLYLHALVNGYDFWLPGVNRAICKRTPSRILGLEHSAPESGCMCGFWLKNSLEGAFSNWTPNYVVGAVQGWGHVIEHADGWRCEFATPLALAYPHFPGWNITGVVGEGLTALAIDDICLRYEIPHVSWEELENWHA